MWQKDGYLGQEWASPDPEFADFLNFPSLQNSEK
jgi:hypothetical protein